MDYKNAKRLCVTTGCNEDAETLLLEVRTFDLVEATTTGNELHISIPDHVHMDTITRAVKCCLLMLGFERRI